MISALGPADVTDDVMDATPNRVPILDEARSAYRVGLCIVPAAADGTKRPDVPTWTGYQTARPTSPQMRAFHFEQRIGFGMIAGPVSGHHAAWDFDCPDTYDAFVSAADATGLGEVVRRIETSYCDRTPGGGRRWIVHYPESVAWRDETLARRPGGDGEPHVKTLIELPTFAILAPSHGPTHPSGRPYIRLFGGFHTITAVTAEEHADLINLARTFDAMPRPQSRARTADQSDDRPGDAFNRRASWMEILEPAGWRHVYDRGDMRVLVSARESARHLGHHESWRSGSPVRVHELDAIRARAVVQQVRRLRRPDITPQISLQRRATWRPGVTEPDPRPHLVAANPRPASRRVPPSASDPCSIRLEDVTPEPVRWLWPGRLAAGKIALLVGDPGLGKSWITLDLAARISAGRAMPDGGPAVDAGNVVLLSAEDGLADTIRPRVDALGARRGSHSSSRWRARRRARARRSTRGYRGDRVRDPRDGRAAARHRSDRGVSGIRPIRIATRTSAD